MDEGRLDLEKGVSMSARGGFLRQRQSIGLEGMYSRSTVPTEGGSILCRLRR